MKKLNKHPRLYKKMANTLKKLITNKIKLVRLKMINGQNKNSLKTNGANIIQHHSTVYTKKCQKFEYTENNK